MPIKVQNWQILVLAMTLFSREADSTLKTIHFGRHELKLGCLIWREKGDLIRY